MLGVYIDVLFAEDRGLSPCLRGGEENRSNVMVTVLDETTVLLLCVHMYIL